MDDWGKSCGQTGLIVLLKAEDCWKLVVAGSGLLRNSINCFERERKKKKSLSLLVHTPPSCGKRVSLTRHSSQANIILEIYFVDLHLGRFPHSGFLAKPWLLEGIGTAEHLHFFTFSWHSRPHLPDFMKPPYPFREESIWIQAAQTPVLELLARLYRQALLEQGLVVMLINIY